MALDFGSVISRTRWEEGPSPKGRGAPTFGPHSRVSAQVIVIKLHRERRLEQRHPRLFGGIHRKDLFFSYTYDMQLNLAQFAEAKAFLPFILPSKHLRLTGAGVAGHKEFFTHVLDTSVLLKH